MIKFGAVAVLYLPKGIPSQPDWDFFREKMETCLFNPNDMGDTTRSIRGFVPPYPEYSDELLVQEGATTLFCLKVREKQIPKKVIDPIFRERLTELQRVQGRKLTPKERKALKDEIELDLLPRALVADRDLMFFSVQNWLFLNIKPDKFVSLMNEFSANFLLGQQLKVAMPVSQTLTEWLETGAPSGNFDLGEDCLLTSTDDPENVSRAKITHQDLYANEVLQHIKSGGKFVKEIELTWADKLVFTLTEKMGLKKIKFPELTKTKAKKGEPKQDIDMTSIMGDQLIVGNCLSGMMNELVQELGGLDDSEPASE